MSRVQAILLVAVTLLAAAFSAPSGYFGTPINVPVVTKYITTEVQTVDQDETIVLIGQLCQQSKGMQVNVSVLLNNNPDWEPTFGVLRYYVVDDLDKDISGALCSNTAQGPAVPNCYVKSWPSDNDVYIKGTAGQSAAISFTLDAEISAPVRGEVHGNASQKMTGKVYYSPKVRRDPIYLTEIVTLSSQQPLAYHKTALMKFTFCATPRTGTRYEVRGAVTGTDGSSSYAQYICDKLPCAVDGPYVIAHNGRQLPSNVVTTASGQWKTMYALVVCWGGVYDPEKDEYIGKFIFNADQLSTK